MEGKHSHTNGPILHEIILFGMEILKLTKENLYIDWWSISTQEKPAFIISAKNCHLFMNNMLEKSILSP